MGRGSGRAGRVAPVKSILGGAPPAALARMGNGISSAATPPYERATTMRAIIVNAARGAAVLLGAAVATVGFGADSVKPAVLAPRKDGARPASAESDGIIRMEIYEGPNRTVYYFGSGTSSSEQATLNELQRAENEMDYL